MIKYLGRYNHKCDMCNKTNITHNYEYELLLKQLYPEGYNTKLCICQKCAKREIGKKKWELNGL